MGRVLLLCCLLLAGCASPGEIKAQFAAQDDKKCRSYGAEPGSAAYVTCRSQLDAARSQALATMAAAPPPPTYQPPTSWPTGQPPGTGF
jgi:hypothetical protein